MAAFILLLSGYSGIRHIYDSGISSSATTISTFTFCLLVACGFMTGAGGNGGLTSSVNSTAKTFPDKTVRVSVLREATLSQQTLAWNSYRHRDFGLWSLGIFIFHYIACFVCRKHVILPISPCSRHVNTNDLWIIFCSTDSLASHRPSACVGTWYWGFAGKPRVTIAG